MIHFKHFCASENNRERGTGEKKVHLSSTVCPTRDPSTERRVSCPALFACVSNPSPRLIYPCTDISSLPLGIVDLTCNEPHSARSHELRTKMRAGMRAMSRRSQSLSSVTCYEQHGCGERCRPGWLAGRFTGRVAGPV